MRTLVYWARDNRWKARIIIIFLIYPLLNLTGWLLGDLLSYHHIHISQAWCYPLSIFFLLLFLVYPFRADKKYRHFYPWKRTVDALMIIASFSFILIRGNNFNSPGVQQYAVTSSYAASQLTSNTSTEPSAKPAKEKKKALKKFLQNLRKKYKNMSREEKTGLIILAVFVAVLLIFGLFALTCSIACSGAEGLAYVVFFLGLGGIIFGLVRVIRRIKLGPRKKKVPIEKSS